jgi:hypothetical protein
MNILFWHWWILSLALVVLEMLAPGTAFFIWMGVAAGITGIVLLLAPSLSWQIQLLVFSAVSIATILVWRSYAKNKAPVSDEPLLNRRGEQYVGRVFTLEEPVVNRFGKLRVDDTTWKIEGEDMPAGTHVRVTGVDGTVLRVARDSV